MQFVQNVQFVQIVQFVHIVQFVQILQNVQFVQFVQIVQMVQFLQIVHSASSALLPFSFQSEGSAAATTSPTLHFHLFLRFDILLFFCYQIFHW